LTRKPHKKGRSTCLKEGGAKGGSNRENMLEIRAKKMSAKSFNLGMVLLDSRTHLVTK
jgi:hypothetical protein